jgi:WD40 repeat protein
MKKNIFITAGQDRRCAIYNLDEKISYYLEASFLIYSAALSPSASLGAYASDEENNVTVFNVNTKKDLYKLLQNKATLTNILFINENEIFVSGDDEKINYYKLN